MRAQLTASICLQNFAWQGAERHNKPEVEAGKHPEVLLIPVTIKRNEGERVLIEGSINSVRVSIQIRKHDEMQVMIVRTLRRFLAQRAESFIILRRQPLPGFDFSFLITNFHTELYYKHKLVDFIMVFIEEIDKHLCEENLVWHARARIVASEFLSRFL